MLCGSERGQLRRLAYRSRAVQCDDGFDLNPGEQNGDQSEIGHALHRLDHGGI